MSTKVKVIIATVLVMALGFGSYLVYGAFANGKTEVAEKSEEKKNSGEEKSLLDDGEEKQKDEPIEEAVLMEQESEDNPVIAEVAKEKEPTEPKNYYKNLEGRWSWNYPADEADSLLEITKQSDDSFDFELYVKSGGHVGEMAGKAKISGNKATYSEEYDGQNCTLKFNLGENVINIEESTQCMYFHGAGVGFVGDFYGDENVKNPVYPEKGQESEVQEKKQPTQTNQSPLFQAKGNKFYIYGVTLGDNIDVVFQKLGQPISEGVDELSGGPYYTFEKVSASAYDNENEMMYMTINKQTFEQEFIQKFTGQKYVHSSNGTYFLYQPNSNQIIMGKEENGAFRVYLVYEDYIFKEQLEENLLVPLL